MSEPPKPPEGRLDSDSFTVFQDSSPEDVSHARLLWSSLSLLPPPESRLVSADIHQRLPVSRGAAAGLRPPPPPAAPLRFAPGQQEEERRRYAAMADQRKEILALMRRQRERRIQKEVLRGVLRPKPKVEQPEQSEEEVKEEKHLVRQLQ